MKAVTNLDALRDAIASKLADGESVPEAQIVARGVDVVPWMLEQSHQWRQLLSTTSRTSVHSIQRSLPNNRVIVSAGLEMISVFDRGGTPQVCRDVLAGETLGSYYVATAPVAMRIVDGKRVIIEGPIQNDEMSIMVVTARPMLEAAFQYWQAVLDTAEPCNHNLPDLGQMTERQHRISELMIVGLTDEAIASLLGVSTRTIRYDLAAILATLDVPSRFAAGMKVQELRRPSAPCPTCPQPSVRA